jgi:hypothetical protein
MQAPELQSRSLDLPAAGEAEAAAAEEEGEGGFRSRALSKVAALAGMAFNVEQRVPDFEQTAKELVHPLFEALKVKVGAWLGAGGGWFPCAMLLLLLFGH